MTCGVGHITSQAVSKSYANYCCVNFMLGKHAYNILHFMSLKIRKPNIVVICKPSRMSHRDQLQFKVFEIETTRVTKRFF